jgi:hypothetical protein
MAEIETEVNFLTEGKKKARDKEDKAGGLLRTGTPPTSNRRTESTIHLSSVSMGIHAEGEACSDLVQVLVLNDPSG